jgi:DNA-binding NarL/FixJ family response regulator
MEIKVFIVDDHQMLIDGIKSLLKGEKKFRVIGEATRALEAFEKFKLNMPDVLITDINMPEISGIELTKMVREAFPSIKILALSMFNERSMISEMLQAGISGYILKNTGKQELLTALERISNGQLFFSEEVSIEMMKAASAPNDVPGSNVNITSREKDIIQLISREYSNKQIAEELSISERTVETHRKNIFRKTNTKSVIGLIKFATENNILD